MKRTSLRINDVLIRVARLDELPTLQEIKAPDQWLARIQVT